MKWGVRRYQNKDGTLTEAGKKRQRKDTYKELKKINNSYERMSKSGEIAQRDHEEKYNEVKEARRKYQEANDKFLDKEYEDMTDEEKKVADKKIEWLNDHYDEAVAATYDTWREYKQKLDDLTKDVIGDKFADKFNGRNKEEWHLSRDVQSGISNRIDTQLHGEKNGLDKSPKKYIEDWNEPLKLSKNFFNDHDQAETVFLEWANLYHPKMSVEEYDRESNRFFNNPDTYTYSSNSGPKHKQH